MPSRGFARELTLSVYLPTAIAEVGLGALLPLFTLSALDMGEPAAIAALAVTVYSVGRIGGAQAGGLVASHRGVVPATLMSLAVLAAGAALGALSTTAGVFAVALVVMGAGHGALHVARQTQVDLMAPLAARARSLATLAGVWRVANFIGPFLGAAAISLSSIRAGYVVAAVLVVASAGVYVALAPHHLKIPRHERERVSPREVLRPHLRVFATLGVGVMLLGAARQARVVVIPLWAEHVGLTPAQVSLVYGVATAIDMVMFIPSGWIMDRWGRLWSGVPSALILTAGMVWLPFTHAEWLVALASAVIGLGNGWGSGVLMTLGADAAPVRGKAVFLGVWTNLQDIGGMLAPAVVAGGALVSIAAGVWAAALTGIAGAGALAKWTPRNV